MCYGNFKVSILVFKTLFFVEIALQFIRVLITLHLLPWLGMIADPHPLMEGEGKSLRVLGFNLNQRNNFMQILMRFVMNSVNLLKKIQYHVDA